MSLNSADYTKCEICGNPHMLTFIEAGSDREVARQCSVCYDKIPECIHNVLGLLAFLRTETDYLPDHLYNEIDEAVHKLECHYF